MLLASNSAHVNAKKSTNNLISVILFLFFNKNK